MSPPIIQLGVGIEPAAYTAFPALHPRHPQARLWSILYATLKLPAQTVLQVEGVEGRGEGGRESTGDTMAQGYGSPQESHTDSRGSGAVCLMTGTGTAAA